MFTAKRKSGLAKIRRREWCKVDLDKKRNLGWAPWYTRWGQSIFSSYWIDIQQRSLSRRDQDSPNHETRPPCRYLRLWRKSQQSRKQILGIPRMHAKLQHYANLYVRRSGAVRSGGDLVPRRAERSTPCLCEADCPTPTTYWNYVQPLHHDTRDL